MGHVHTFLWAVAGLLGILTLREACVPVLVERGLQAPYGRAPDGRLAPLVHPRGVRRARGIGRLRALEVADWAWAMGGPSELERIPGVGPVTAGPLGEAVASILKGDGFCLHSPPDAPR